MNNHTHHHNGSIVLKVTATITVIFLVAITLNQIILNRHINDTIEENMEETVLRTAEQTENYLSTRVSGSIERLLYFKAESGLDSILANYFANPNAAAYSVAMSNLAAPLSTKKVSDSLISDLYLYTDYGAFTDGSTLLTPGFSLEKVALWSEIREGNSFLEFCTVRNDEIFRSRKWVVPVLYRFSISSAQVYSATRKCILVVNLDCKEIQALIRKIVPEAESAILVLDQEGNPVTCVNAAAEELMREPGAVESADRRKKYSFGCQIRRKKVLRCRPQGIGNTVDHRVSAGIYHSTGRIPILSAAAACGRRDTDHGNRDSVPADAPLVHSPLAGVDQLPECEAGVLL